MNITISHIVAAVATTAVLSSVLAACGADAAEPTRPGSSTVSPATSVDTNTSRAKDCGALHGWEKASNCLP